MIRLVGAGLIVLAFVGCDLTASTPSPPVTKVETPPYVIYLMWPPAAADGQPKLTAPLRTWQQDGGCGPWTSIAECQEGRRSLEDYLVSIRDRGRSEEDKLWGYRQWLLVRESLCIASNDLRLGGR
jgi:hypothetical protein